MTDDEWAIHDAPQPARAHGAPTLDEIHQWIAITPSPRDRALLAILLRIDAHIAENTALKRTAIGASDEA
jgi:hypothetical protein